MSDETDWIDTEQKSEQIDRRYFLPIKIDTGAYDD